MKRGIPADFAGSIFVRCREHIGDIVNSTPALQTIRQGFPRANITVEVGTGLLSLVDDPMFGDRFVERPRREGAWQRLKSIRWMRRQRFRMVVVLDESRPLMVQAVLAGVPVRCGVHKGKSPWLYTVGVEHRQDVHECRGNFARLLEAMGLDPIKDPGVPTTETHLGRAREAMTAAGLDLGRPIFGVHWARPHDRRHWPAEHVVVLAGELAKVGVQTALLGAEEDRASLPVESDLFDLRGRFGLLETAAALGEMDAFVGGDSGPMHMAAAMKTFSVCLYQFGARAAYTGPYGDHHVILSAEGRGLGAIDAARVLGVLDERLERDLS